jgi:hypothetical protein
MQYAENISIIIQSKNAYITNSLEQNPSSKDNSHKATLHHYCADNSLPLGPILGQMILSTPYSL